MNDTTFAFNVYAQNVIGACDQAWARLRKSMDKVAAIHNDDTYPGKYKVGEHTHRNNVFVYGDNDDVLCLFCDIELINEQEYESLDESVIKDFV